MVPVQKLCWAGHFWKIIGFTTTIHATSLKIVFMQQMSLKVKINSDMHVSILWQS